MSRPTRIVMFAILTCVVGGLGLLVFNSQVSDPGYEGKPLSYWFEKAALSGPPPALRRTREEEKLDHILSELGNSAIPFLLRMLEKTDSGLKTRLIELAGKQNLVKVKVTPADRLNWEAGRALAHMGKGASNAVPELIRILEGDYSWSTRSEAFFALDFIGPAASNAIPTLLRIVAQTNSTERVEALHVLGFIESAPTWVVPALTNALIDKDPHVRRMAAHTLIFYSSDAVCAVPQLNLMLNDPDTNVMASAEEALEYIKRAACAKKGVE